MLDLVDENIYENDELKHWGILGMRWGIRRFQYEDGTLTPEGKIRYSKAGKEGLINYINDNWKRAQEQVKKEMEYDSNVKNFVEDHGYIEYRMVPYEDDPEYFSKYYRPDIFAEQGEPEEYADYYTILAARAQELLENEYEELFKDEELNDMKHSEDELFHWKYVKSEDGLRYYMKEDGSYTIVGKGHHNISKNQRNFYNDPRSVQPLFDRFYADRKAALNKHIRENGGNKSYKGYERAEFHNNDAYQDPKKSSFEIKSEKRRKRLHISERPSDEIPSNVERKGSQLTNEQNIVKTASYQRTDDEEFNKRIMEGVETIDNMNDFLNQPLIFIISKTIDHFKKK